MNRDDPTARDPHDTSDDPIARTLLDGSPFHQRRLAVGITQLSQRRKLHVFAAIAGALALCLPIGVTLPAAVRATYLGGAPLSASPVILVVGLFGLAAEVAAGVTVAAVSYRARTGSLTEQQALRLVALDNVATVAGLGVGALAVLAALCGLAVGYGGVETVRAFGSPDNGVSGPYTSASLIPSVGTVGGLALFVCGLLALLGVVVGSEP
jgi:hypothetical protein